MYTYLYVRMYTYLIGDINYSTYHWVISYQYCTRTMPGKKTPPGRQTSPFDVTFLVSFQFLPFFIPLSISFLLFSPVFSLHLCSSPFASPLPYPLCSSLSNSSRTAVQRARHSTESTVNVQNNELEMYFRINVLGCEIHWKRVCIWHVKIFLREHGVTAICCQGNFEAQSGTYCKKQHCRWLGTYPNQKQHTKVSINTSSKAYPVEGQVLFHFL